LSNVFKNGLLKFAGENYSKCSAKVLRLGKFWHDLIGRASADKPYSRHSFNNMNMGKNIFHTLRKELWSILAYGESSDFLFWISGLFNALNGLQAGNNISQPLTTS